MRAIPLFISISLILLLNSKFLSSQQAIIPSGNDISSAEGSISYTLGQVSYSLNANSSVSISQGVQQPYEISTWTFVLPDSKARMGLSAFPNPTTYNLQIQVSGEFNKPLEYKLLDVAGKKILHGEILSSKWELETQDLPASVYFLQVSFNNMPIATHKIIKF